MHFVEIFIEQNITVEQCLKSFFKLPQTSSLGQIIPESDFFESILNNNTKKWGFKLHNFESGYRTFLEITFIEAPSSSFLIGLASDAAKQIHSKVAIANLLESVDSEYLIAHSQGCFQQAKCVEFNDYYDFIPTSETFKP